MSSPLRPGDELTCVASRVVADGRAVALHDGVEVHLYGLFPGERCLARVTAVDRHRGRVHAEVVDLIVAHAHRRAVPCASHEAVAAAGCTGCPWMPWTAPHQRSTQLALLRSLGLPVSVVHTVPSQQEAGLGYRWSAKRVAGLDARGRPRLGSYRRRSHELASMRGCEVDHPRLSAVADHMERLLEQGVLPVWTPQTARGLRYVWLKTNGDKVLMTLICEGLNRRDLSPLAEVLEDVEGLAWARSAGSGNAIKGTDVEHLRGVRKLEVTLNGVTVAVGPLGFLQPNPPVAKECYRAMLSDEEGEPLKGRVAFDLYAGAGVTTHGLRRMFAEVFPCESWPESAQLLGVEPRSVESFLRAPPREDVDLVVANPPRAGLGAEAAQALVRLAPTRLHVMSCSPTSLRRDLDVLMERYDIVACEAWATLPQTPHVELVAKLVRRVDI